MGFRISDCGFWIANFRLHVAGYWRRTGTAGFCRRGVNPPFPLDSFQNATSDPFPGKGIHTQAVCKTKSTPRMWFTAAHSGTRWIAAVAIGLTSHAFAQDSPRLRTILPSGSIVYVENMPRARYVSVQLIASSEGVRETPESHGHRHLLEHLLVKGPDKGLGHRLESQGIFMAAETHRDAMVFSLVVPSEKIPLALGAVQELLQPLQASPAELERERNILAEELALSPSSMRLSKALWAGSFGVAGLDPVGTAEGWAKATPEKLEFLRRRHFAAQNLVLSICGNLDVDEVTKAARAVLPKDKDPFEPDLWRRKAGKPSAASEPNASARGAASPGWSEPETAALLAAALALAGERDKGFVTYTPSVAAGVVILGQNEPGLGAWIDRLTPGQIDALYPFGRYAADAWVRRQMESPEGNAFFRGFLYCQNREAQPDALLENVRAMTLGQFREAVAQFHGAKNR